MADADADAIISKSTIQHSNAAGGITSIDLTNVDTDQAPGVYYYDIQVKDAANRIQSTQVGKLTIIDDVTVRTT